MKIRFILKFFLKTNYNNFRFSFIIPFVGILVGSYIIFMTYSIMNSMEKEIEHKINSFNYKYSYPVKDAPNQEVNLYDNSGYNNIVYAERLYSKRFSELIAYDNIEHFIDKIDPYIIDYDRGNVNKGLFVGREFSKYFGLDVGDSLEVYFPTEINLVTSFIPSAILPVCGIYNYNMFDFDDRYIIVSTDAINDFGQLTQSYYSDSPVFFGLNQSNDNLLISAIQLEKKLYTGLSFLLIIISCIIIFNIMTMVMMDKNKQIDYLNIIGLDNFKILKIMLFFNSLSSLIFTLTGYLLSELTIFCNYYYGFFGFLFRGLPFKITPVNVSFYELLVIYLCINFLIISFSTFPYKLRKEFK